MTEEVLINLVNNYPHLYLCGDKNYHNQQMKENAWEEISSEMKISVDDCKKKWKNLKDCYRKALSKKRTKSGDSAESIPKKWKYEDEMSFLLPNLKERKQKSNLNTSVIETVTRENDEDDDEHPFSPEVIDDTLLVPSPSTSNSSVASKTNRCRRPELKSAEVLQNFLDNKEKRKKQDHLSKFFESAEETTRMLPHELQIEIKHKISMLLYEYEIKAINKAHASSHTEQENIQLDSFPSTYNTYFNL